MVIHPCGHFFMLGYGYGALSSETRVFLWFTWFYHILSPCFSDGFHQEEAKALLRQNGPMDLTGFYLLLHSSLASASKTWPPGPKNSCM